MNADQKEAVRERARRALSDLYHNATPTYPRELYGRTEEEAQAWFNSAAEFEIEYMQGGGAYACTEAAYRKILSADCNAGRYKSQAARDYYVRKGMRAMREERAKYAAWERINEYGKLYQWGRGGRTLAPSDLIQTRGGSGFSIREDYADDMRIADVVELIRILESFNKAVGEWCRSVPEQWKDYCADDDAQREAQEQEDARREALRQCFC